MKHHRMALPPRWVPANSPLCPPPPPCWSHPEWLSIHPIPTGVPRYLLLFVLARWFFPSSPIAHLCLLNTIWPTVSSSKQETWIAGAGQWACKPCRDEAVLPLPSSPPLPPHRHGNTELGTTVLRKKSNRSR